MNYGWRFMTLYRRQGSRPLTHNTILIPQKRKKKVGGRVKQRKKNKRRPTMLTVLGCPPWTVSEEKTPQSGLIRKGTDNHTT